MSFTFFRFPWKLCIYPKKQFTANFDEKQLLQVFSRSGKDGLEGPRAEALERYVGSESIQEKTRMKKTTVKRNPKQFKYKDRHQAKNLDIVRSRSFMTASYLYK